MTTATREEKRFWAFLMVAGFVGLILHLIAMKP